EHHWPAFRRRPQRYHVHRRTDRRADERLGDAVAIEHGALPLGLAAAVAAHGWHQERLGPELLQELDDALQDQRDISNATAAGRQGHALAGPDGLAEIEALECRANRGGDVFDFGPFEMLPYAHHLGKRHGKLAPLPEARATRPLLGYAICRT